MTEHEHMMKVFTEGRKVMPEEMYQAFCVILDNFNPLFKLVQEVCREQRPSPEEVALWRKNAFQEKQHLLYFVLSMAEIIVTNGDEPL